MPTLGMAEFLTFLFAQGPTRSNTPNLEAVPAIEEFGEATQLLATGRGGVRGGASLQRRDVLAQFRAGGNAQRVVQPPGTAEAQHLGRAIMAVGPQHDRKRRGATTLIGSVGL